MTSFFEQRSKPSDANADVQIPKWLINATIAASHQDIEGSDWQLGLLNDLDNADLIQRAQRLVTHSDHPNIFFDPGFLSLSSRSISRNKVRYLFLAETHGGEILLRFFAPVTIERVSKIGPKFLRIWSSEFAPLGLPLVDRKDMERTVEELCICLSRAGHTLAKGMLVPTIPKSSRFANLMVRHGKIDNSLVVFNPYSRACIKPHPGKSYFNDILSAKRRQRLNAAWRKLSELGTLSITRSATIPDAEMHLLDFLYIEQRSWKGRNNSAMMNRDETRQLATGGIKNLVLNGKCEVFSLYLDETVIASVIFLNTKGYYTAWKTTYNERYARYSAGNLLLTHATDEITSREDFMLMDSVATGSNDNANRIWKDRLEIISMSMEFGNRGGMLARQIANNLSLLMDFKSGLRKLLGR